MIHIHEKKYNPVCTCVKSRATVSGGNGLDRHLIRSDKTAGQYSIKTKNSSMVLPLLDGRLPLAEVMKFTILLQKYIIRIIPRILVVKINIVHGYDNICDEIYLLCEDIVFRTEISCTIAALFSLSIAKSLFNA